MKVLFQYKSRKGLWITVFFTRLPMSEAVKDYEALRKGFQNYETRLAEQG